MNANSLVLTVSVVGLILFSADWRKLDAADSPPMDQRIVITEGKPLWEQF
ncbi:MAG: hypothetical protein KDN20_09695 [Verrucomicrobiae bacterium]|nr:hypothetical protein [Verrucomicrobiae bacterium]